MSELPVAREVWRSVAMGDRKVVDTVARNYSGKKIDALPPAFLHLPPTYLHLFGCFHLLSLASTMPALSWLLGGMTVRQVRWSGVVVECHGLISKIMTRLHLMETIIASTYKAAHQMLALCLVLSTALVIWKGMAVSLDTESPIVVVLRWV